MIEWFSYAVAIILLLSSIISPWLVNRENNRHQLSLKKLDMYEESKRKALNEFIKYATNLRFNDTVGATDEFYKSVNCLHIYFKNIPSNIENLRLSRNDNSFSNELTNIVQELSKQIAKE